jgi:hypothetical protein
MKFTDRAIIGTTKATQEGYLIATARAVRTGIQDYRASELGMVGNHIVRVMRPEEEVFAADSLQSFSHAPVTINHPAELVDADNWRSLAVGEVSSDVLRDGEFLAVPLILKDAAAIKSVADGKRELSAGYTADMEAAPEGVGYDFVQRNIRINHLALVDKARAGSKARIGDGADNWGIAPLTTTDEAPHMELKAVAFGDKAIKVAPEDAETLTKIVSDKDNTIGELTAKLADAESKVLTDEQVQEKAKAIADAMSRREKVKARLGDAADKMTDAQIEGALTVIDATPAPDDAARKALMDRKPAKVDDKDNGQSEYEKRLANAYKGGK